MDHTFFDDYFWNQTNLTGFQGDFNAFVWDFYSNVLTSNPKQSLINLEMTRPPKKLIGFFKICSCIRIVIIIAGLFGNLISFQILARKRSTTNVYLCSLCFASFFALLGDIFVVISQLQFVYTGIFGMTLKMYPYLYPLMLTFQMAYIYLTVAVSVNQFVCIYFQKGHANLSKLFQKSKKQKDCKRALIIVCFIFLFSVLFCLPYWKIYEYNYETGLVELTATGKDDVFNLIVHFILYLPVVYLIPFIIIIFTNVYLITYLIDANKNKKLLVAIKRPQKLHVGFIFTLKNKSSDGYLSVGSAQCKSSDDTDKSLLKNSKKVNLMNEASKKFNYKTMRTSVMLILVVFSFILSQFPNLIIHILELKKWNIHNSLKIIEETIYYKEISRILIIFYLSFNFAYYACFNNFNSKNLKKYLCKN